MRRRLALAATLVFSASVAGGGSADALPPDPPTLTKTRAQLKALQVAEPHADRTFDREE